MSTRPWGIVGLACCVSLASAFTARAMGLGPGVGFAWGYACGLTACVLLSWVAEWRRWRREERALMRELAPLLKRAEEEHREANAKGGGT